MDALRALGGVDGLAAVLRTNPHTGIESAPEGATSAAARQETFGKNKLPESKPANFFLLMVRAWQPRCRMGRWRMAHGAPHGRGEPPRRRKKLPPPAQRVAAARSLHTKLR